ncbi:MAG: tetratricopeptide repeat protein [bacterium]
MVCEAEYPGRKFFKGKSVIAALILLPVAGFASSQNAEQNILSLRKGLAVCAVPLKISEGEVKLGQEHARRGENRKALAWFRAAWRLSPESIYAANALASALARGEKFDEAVRIYERVLVFHPESAAARENLGRLHQLRGDHAASEKELLAALKKNETPGRYSALGDTYFLCRKWEKARDAYMKSLSMDPVQPSVFVRLGRSFLFLGSPDTALDAFRNAAALDKKNFTAWYELARLQAMKGEKTEALKSLAFALRKGLVDIKRIKADPAFGQLEKEPGYKDITGGKAPKRSGS